MNHRMTRIRQAHYIGTKNCTDLNGPVTPYVSEIEGTD